MISSDIPVFIARVALCSTWLAGAKRRRKKSCSVGFFGIGSSFLTLPRLLDEEAAGAAPVVARFDLRLDLGDGREFFGWPCGGDLLVEVLFHPVLERIGLGFRSISAPRRRLRDSR